MTVVKYDVSDVEAGGGGEEPQPATYPGKIVSMVNRKKKSDGKTPISDMEVVVDIGKEYVRLWTYVKLPDDPEWNKDSHGWKLRELTDALGLPPKGSIDTKKAAGTPVLVKITADTHQDDSYRGKIKNLFPAKADQDDPAAAEGSSSSDEGPYPRDEIEGWPEDDIKSYAEEIGADGPTSGRGWKGKLIDSIISKQDETDDGEPEPDADGTSPALEGVDQSVLDELKPNADHYVDWPDDDIKWMVDGLGIDGNVATSGRGWKAKAIAAIVEIAAGAGAGAPEGDEPTVADDYDDKNDDGSDAWSLDDFKAEIAERNEQGAEIPVPKGRVTREKLIELLRADNAVAEAF